jgi:hypothetical protein
MNISLSLSLSQRERERQREKERRREGGRERERGREGESFYGTQNASMNILRHHICVITSTHPFYLHLYLYGQF